MIELALILPVKLHASSQKSILVISDTGLPVGIRQTGVVARYTLMKMHQAVIIIRKAGRRMELTSPIPHGIILQMIGTSCLAQQSPS